MSSFFQSNEEKSSAHMEKGLVRCIEYLQIQNVTINSKVTDLHVQIVKWICEFLYLVIDFSFSLHRPEEKTFFFVKRERPW